MLALMVSVPVSGGHINPCITVAWALRGKFPWRKVGNFLLAQHIGACLASLTVLVVYFEVVENVGAGVIASAPNNLHEHSNVGYKVLDYCHLILDQFMASFLLVLAFSSIVLDKHNPGPLLMGLTVTGIVLALGPNAGAAMNPALDLMSRLKVIMIGVLKSYEF